MTISSALLVAVAFLLPPGRPTLVHPAKPPMGWNSYNYYGCDINDKIIRANAQGLVSLGLSAKGYDTVTPDCGWPSRDRTSDGKITWNSTLFSSGFPALGKYIHSLGLKFGLYSGAGVWQCSPDNGAAHWQASLGHEASDAESFASWGGDALKYDNCFANLTEGFVNYNPSEPDPSVRFAAMANALAATNRSIAYAICQWGVGNDLGQWAPAVGGATWRISNDIQNNWASIWRIVNQVAPYYRHTGPGKGFADMDMLTVGLQRQTKFTAEEERFHFGMWAVLKSPLVIGSSMDGSNTPKESLAILGNEEVIALNQDALGKQVQLVRRYTEEEYDIWAGDLSGSRKVVAIPNWSKNSKKVELSLGKSLGIQSADIRDIWKAQDLGKLNGSVSLKLAGHEAKLLILSNIAPNPAQSIESTYYPASGSVRSSGARYAECTKSCSPSRWNNCTNACTPAKSKVTFAVGASVKFSNISAGSEGGKKLVGVDYINYDVALGSAWTNGSNTRNLTLSVNGGTPKRWAFPISGGDWYESGRLNIELDGFAAGSNNTVVVTARGPDAGPDLVGLEVYQ